MLANPFSKFKSFLIKLISLVIVLQALGVAPSLSAFTETSCATAGFDIKELYDTADIDYFAADYSKDLKSGYLGLGIINTIASPQVKVDTTGSNFSLGANESNIVVSRSSGNGSLSNYNLAYIYLTSSAKIKTSQSLKFHIFSGDATNDSNYQCTYTQTFNTGIGDGNAGDAQQTNANTVDSMETTLSSSTPLNGTFTVTLNGNTGTWGATGSAQPYSAFQAATAANWYASSFQLIGINFKIVSDGVNKYDKITTSGISASSKTYKTIYTFYVNSWPNSNIKLQPINYVTSGGQLKHNDKSQYSNYTAATLVTNGLSATTNAATSVSSNTATLNGSTSSSFAATIFCISSTPSTDFTVNGSGVCSSGDSVTATAATSPNYFADITGLTAGTRYYFQFVGLTGTSGSYTSTKGSVLSFVTPGGTTYTVTYYGNSNSSGSVPVDADSPYLSGETATVLGNVNSLGKTNFNFNGWCTTQPAAGSSCTTGTAYVGGDTFTVTSNVSLYAIWDAVAPSGGGAAPAPRTPTPPTVTSISAPEVCAIGDQLVIKGTYLNGATATLDGDSIRVISSSFNEMNVALPMAFEGVRTIRVTNSDGSASTTIKYRFVDTPVYVNYVYPETFKDLAFSYTFKATDAEKYAIQGKMPAGLTLNPLTGELTGTPTEEGDFIFNIVASNLCASTTLIVYMFVDKAIPDSYSCSVAFNVPSSNNISEIKLSALKTCLDKMVKLSPKYIDPVIFLSGGVPMTLSIEEQLAHPRYAQIVDFIRAQGITSQIYVGAFEGPLDQVQLNFYWPVTFDV